MNKVIVRDTKMICCQKRKEMLSEIINKKLGAQESIIMLGALEWIKWTKSKKICEECKVFRADSLNAMDEKTTEVDKDAYLKKYFVGIIKQQFGLLWEKIGSKPSISLEEANLLKK